MSTDRNGEDRLHEILGILSSDGIDCVEDVAEYMSAVEDKRLCNDPERIVCFKSLFESLSSEAREVVSIIVHVPEELNDFLMMNDDGFGKLCKRSISEYLRFKGWKYTTINKCFRQIGSAIAQNF